MLKINQYIKYIISNSLLKNASFLIIGTFASSLVSFIFIIIATHLFQPKDVGLSSAAISAIGIISTISELGLGITLIRFLHDSGKNENALLNYFLTINIIASLVVTIVFLCGLDLWSSSLVPIREDKFFIIVFLLFAVAQSAQPILLNVFLAKRQNKYAPIINGIIGIFKVLFILLLSLLFNNKFGILLAAGIATFIGALILILYFIPRVQKNYKFQPRLNYPGSKEYFHYAAGNYIGRLLLGVTPLMLPLIVLNTLGPESNAVFYVAWSITSILQIIPTAVFNSLFAEASTDSQHLKNHVMHSIKFMFLILIPAIIITILISEKFLLIFGKSYSLEGESLLQIAACSTIPFGINYLYISIARFEKHSGKLIFIAALSVVLTILFSYIFMKTSGLNGIGLGYLVGQCIPAMVATILLMRMFSKSKYANQVTI